MATYNPISTPKHLLVGGLIYAIMSALWLLITFLLNPLSPYVITLLSILIGSLIITSIILLTKTKAPKSTSSHTQKLGKWFGVIFALEGLLVGTGSGILAVSDQIVWIVPWVALIVGLHFFPLGFLLKLKMDYLLGLSIIAVVVAVTLSLRESWWSYVIGISTCLLLLLAGWGRVFRVVQVRKNEYSSI